MPLTSQVHEIRFVAYTFFVLSFKSPKFNVLLQASWKRKFIVVFAVVEAVLCSALSIEVAFTGRTINVVSEYSTVVAYERQGQGFQRHLGRCTTEKEPFQVKQSRTGAEGLCTHRELSVLSNNIATLQTMHISGRTIIKHLP